MKINPSAALHVYKAAERNAVSHPQETSHQNEGAVHGEHTDQVAISAEGARKAEAKQVTGAILAQIQEPASPERIETLRKQVQDGTYHVATGDLVDAIMKRWFGA